MQQRRPENPPAMTFDEVSMERSKNFVKALQELKNLRPQLYSAAEYCEKSYLHSEQKQMVLDNLKDYAVRALVNAVDHLGTVAYKLTDLFEQQTLDISTVELKISCLNQQVLTCQTYAHKEGLRQQQMLAATQKHHKHYILPNSASNRIQSNLPQHADAMQNDIQAKPRPYTSGTPASKTLSWLLASETGSASNGAPNAKLSNGDSKASKMASEIFHLMEEAAAPLTLSSHLQSASGPPTSKAIRHAFCVTDPMQASRPLSAFRSFENPRSLEVHRPPARSKSVLSSFFSKNKPIKPKRPYVS